MTDEWRGEGPFNRPHEGVYWRIDDGETCIAVVYTESDARLMAAAPKMAKALRAILPLVTCEDKGNDTRCPQEDMACYKCKFLADEARAALLAAGVARNDAKTAGLEVPCE
jgi:hypothetical protein